MFGFDRDNHSFALSVCVSLAPPLSPLLTFLLSLSPEERLLRASVRILQPPGPLQHVLRGAASSVAISEEKSRGTHSPLVLQVAHGPHRFLYAIYV